MTEPVTVKRVVAGDALKIIYQGQEESVRLIGIDTSESKKNKKAYKDAGRSGKDVEQITAIGKEAARYMRTIAREADRMTIEFDVQKRDKYKRLLGYVYLVNGSVLSEEIIKAGYASPMTIPPNVKYRDRFLKLFREARDARKGCFGNRVQQRSTVREGYNRPKSSTAHHHLIDIEDHREKKN
jgi:micrococcal nuclease